MSVDFVFGGARSGKSRFAERLAAAAAGGNAARVLYIATAQASDGEMAARIERHRRDRPSGWRTREEPLDVAGCLAACAAEPVVLIDCLSLLLNNWMFQDVPALGQETLDRDILAAAERVCEQRSRALVEALAAHPGRVVCVSNEAGQGIVPADPRTRLYRDWLGWLNQAVAGVAERVYWVAAGVGVDLRRLEARL